MTLFGEEVLSIGIVCIAFWCVNREFAYKTGAVFFISGLFVQGLKIACRIERPWIIDPAFHPVVEALSTATGYSFPSGHTQAATALFASIAFGLPKLRKKAVDRAIRLLCVVIFLLVGISRMYLGVHTPYDVGCSMLISLITAAAVFLLPRFMKKSEKPSAAPSEGWIALSFGLFSISVMIYALILQHIGHIDSAYAADCCKAAGAGMGFALGRWLERTYLHYDPIEQTLALQSLKGGVGLVSALLIKTILKIILPVSLYMDALRYLITVLWVLAIYPALIILFRKKFSKTN